MFFSWPYRKNADDTFIALKHHFLNCIRNSVQLLNSMRIFLQKAVWNSTVSNHIPHFFPDNIRVVACTDSRSKKKAAQIRRIKCPCFIEMGMLYSCFFFLIRSSLKSLFILQLTQFILHQAVNMHCISRHFQLFLSTSQPHCIPWINMHYISWKMEGPLSTNTLIIINFFIQHFLRKQILQLHIHFFPQGRIFLNFPNGSFWIWRQILGNFLPLRSFFFIQFQCLTDFWKPGKKCFQIPQSIYRILRHTIFPDISICTLMHAISNHMVNAIPKSQILFPEISHSSEIWVNLPGILCILADLIAIDHI